MTPVARIEWLNAVMRDGNLPRNAAVVAGVLATYCRSESSIARPGNDRIAKESGTVTRTVIRMLARLEAGGYVRQTPRRRGADMPLNGAWKQ